MMKILIWTSSILISLGYSQSLYPLNSIPLNGRDIAFSGGGESILTHYGSHNPSSIIKRDGVGIHTQIFPTGVSLLAADVFIPTSKYMYVFTIANLHFGTFKDGVSNETFSANDILFKGALKSKWSSISVGISGAYNYSNIESTTSQSVYFSMGMRSQISRRSGFGISLKNIGYIFDDYGNNKESVEPQIQISIYTTPSYLPAIVFTDIKKYAHSTAYKFISGIELNTKYKIKLRLSSALSIANTKINSENLGLGIKFKLLRWDMDIASGYLPGAGFINSLTLSKTF